MKTVLPEIFASFDLEDDTEYGINKLYGVMWALGVIRMTQASFLATWLHRHLKNGTLILPPKKTKHASWKFTGRQIKEITLSFVPGGPGRYDWQKGDMYVQSM